MPRYNLTDPKGAAELLADNDLWDATEPPRYMERAFGCPAKEYVEEHESEQVSLSGLAQESRAASEALAHETAHEGHEPSER